MDECHYVHCSCGRLLAVHTAQAGLTVRCHCGAVVAVPSLRDLVQPASGAPPPRRRTLMPTWGKRQGCMLLGSVIVISVLSGACWVRYHKPSPPDVCDLSPVQTWVMWQQLRQGPDRRLSPAELECEDRLAEYRRHLDIMLVFALLGSLLILRGIFTPQAWQRQRLPFKGLAQERL